MLCSVPWLGNGPQLPMGRSGVTWRPLPACRALYSCSLPRLSAQTSRGPRCRKTSCHTMECRVRVVVAFALGNSRRGSHLAAIAWPAAISRGVCPPPGPSTFEARAVPTRSPVDRFASPRWCDFCSGFSVEAFVARWCLGVPAEHGFERERFISLPFLSFGGRGRGEGIRGR